MTNGKIRILSDDIISRIAAGEVVERPASVVKELIENAIDSGATRIEVEVKDGGQKLIEITDNGEGMCQQDAIQAFTPHATSKITDDSEIENIMSLGFRGEALPTIASVSRVSLVTHHASEEIGSKITVDGGRITNVENDSHPCGTRIQVRNLFYNVPVRRKFLKSVASEMAAISDIVCHYMMGYPEIAFKFTKSNVQLAATNGSGNLSDAILAVYGPEVAKDLIQLKEPLSITGVGMSLRGYISPPNKARAAARYMTTLVNRRVVKTKLLSQAVSKATSAFFPRGKYPVLVLDLRVPPGMIDVNVHPQKTEIRFKDERWVFSTIWEMIQSSLSGLRLVSTPFSQNDKHVTETPNLPELEIETNMVSENKLPFKNLAEKVFPSSSIFADLSEMSACVPNDNVSFRNHNDTSAANSSIRSYEIRDRETKFIGSHSETPTGAFEPVVNLRNPKLLAQLKNSYLLGEDDKGLFIIDQHAAHERILFDQYTKTYQNIEVSSQPLLFPVSLQLLPSERMIIKEQLDELKSLGFIIHQEEDGQFYVTSAPIPEKFCNEAESLQNVLAQILEGWEGRSLAEIKCDLLKIMACKASVKAGDPLDPSEWNSLMVQLLKTENPFTCPHGRPVIIRLTTRQIETSFLRV